MEGGVPKGLGLPLDPVLPEGGASLGSPAADVVVDKVGASSWPRFIALELVRGWRKPGVSPLWALQGCEGLKSHGHSCVLPPHFKGIVS